MKKTFLLFFILPFLVTGCRSNKNTPVSVLEDESSLVNQWYGKNHFKEQEKEKKPESPVVTNFIQPSFVMTPAGIVEEQSSEMLSPPESKPSEGYPVLFSEFIQEHKIIELEDSEPSPLKPMN